MTDCTREYDIDTMQLAENFCKLAKNNTEENVRAVEEAIRYFKITAQNRYNFDYFRAFYKTFVNALEDMEVKL